MSKCVFFVVLVFFLPCTVNFVAYTVNKSKQLQKENYSRKHFSLSESRSGELFEFSSCLILHGQNIEKNYWQRIGAKLKKILHIILIILRFSGK